MLIGIDFDNTIVCYDELFLQLARTRGLAPDGLARSKRAVRDHLRAVGREDVWTELQGEAYGAQLRHANAFAGVEEFFRRCVRAGIGVVIVSHKTLHPFSGPAYDLHAAAIGWLEQHGFFDPARIGLPRDRVFLELTKARKIQRIAELGCTHFIDDLPEFLADADFPVATKRLLFDPAGSANDEPTYQRFESWPAISDSIFGGPRGLQQNDEIQNAAASLTAKERLGSVVSITPLPGGGNNRAYRVATTQRDLLLKEYFRDAADPRDRLAAEFAFSGFAWAHGVRALPEPLACDPQNAIGLYSFVPGRMLGPDEVTPARIDEALDFFIAINRHRHEPSARRIADGSEAFFSIAEHLDGVAKRVTRLEQIPGDTPIVREAVAFVTDELRPAWGRVSDHVRSALASPDGDPPLPPDQRCLSPSDFGFHNAILTSQGPLVFHDFEYAGWDDPARAACDFFCQPRLPAPPAMFDSFVQKLTVSLGLSPAHVRRARLLRGVYQIKWCCIMLNEFLPLGARRRSFAATPVDADARKATQLSKARRALTAMDKIVRNARSD